MRLLIGWIVFLGLAAISRWVVSPYFYDAGTKRSTEVGELDLAAPLYVGMAAPIFGVMIPLLLIGAAIIVTIQVLFARFAKWLQGR